MNEDEEDLNGTGEQEIASNVKEKMSKAKEVGSQTKQFFQKKLKEKSSKMVAKAGSKAIFANPYVLAITLIVILILIIIIGICGFFATMPGLMSGKLKQIAQGVADAWQTLYKTGADAKINKPNIIDTAEYIRSMGYDLIGYGFIPARNLSQDSSISKGLTEDGHLKDASGNVICDSGTYYDEYGIGYATTGTETGVEGSFETAGTVNDYLDETDVSILKTYALSDMRLYCIRNYDATIDTMNTIHDWFLNNDSDWAGGLLSLYHAKNFIATGEYKKAEAGYIRAYPSSKTMKVKVGWNNNEMIFKLDGWSGRYGLSLEFLLSLHLATMAPELVTTMARTFDTEVQVYLDEVEKVTVTAYYKNEVNGEYFTYDDMDQVEGAGIVVIGNKDACTLMKELDLLSQEEGRFKCNCGSKNKVVYLNGLTDNTGEDVYEKLITNLSSGYYMQNLIKGKGDGDEDADYEYIEQSNSWSDFVAKSDVQNSDDGNGKADDFYHVINCIHAGIRYIYTNYGSWIDYEDDNEERKANQSGNSVYRYYDSNENIERLEDYAPFKEVKSLSSDIHEFEICSYKDRKDDDLENQRIVRLSLFAARTGADHNYDFAVAVYEIPSVAEKEGSQLCSDHFDESNFTKVCTPCEKYVETIRNALKDIKDDNFKSYTPYIARVVDSWFRDTYFVVPDDDATDGTENDSNPEDVAINDVYNDTGKATDYGTDGVKLTGSGIKYVKVDDEYFKETDEIWSKYETTTHPTTGETVYVLYALKSNGTIDESTKYIETIDDDGNEGYLVNGTTYKSKADIESSNIELVKKAITGNISDGERSYGDLVWHAYASGKQSGEGEKQLLEVHTGSPKAVRYITEYDSATSEYKEILYYTMTDLPTITQKEDGRRGITNPIIKKMFKNRKYYIYDGTSETAEAIYKDWKKVVETNFGGIEEAAEKAIDNYYYNGTGSDPRNPDLIGNITINKDTLNAFSILENTNTLDSDYQYRDFKELIVELNYFDKEDLSDKVEEVFTWIMPEHQEKWPLRLIDKSEEYYGTLIHSDKALVKIKQDLGIETADPADPAAPVETEEDDDEAIGEIKNATGYTQDIDIVSPVTGEVISYGTYKRENTDLIKEYEEQGKNKQDLVDQGIQIEEEVGFIQIRALEKPDIFTSSNCSGDISVDVEGKNYSFSKEKVWNSYYEEYEDVCEGYIVTIDGIKLLELDNGTKITSLEELISNANNLETADGIKPNVTPNLVDDEKEKENQAKENAKIELEAAKVIPTTDGNKLYIKEGTKIGKTTYSTEFPDYSYTRIILRNEKLEIQEDVEKYFDLPMTMTLTGTPYSGKISQEAANWIGITLEGGEDTSHMSGDNYIAYEVIIKGKSDGTVTIGPGVTNWDNPVFYELGYGEYMKGRTAPNTGMDVGDLIPKTVVMDVYAAVLDKLATEIEGEFPDDIVFTDYEMAALIATKYQRGNLNAIKNEVILYKRGQANNLQSVWEQAPADGRAKRRKAEYILFSTGVYTENVYG